MNRSAAIAILSLSLTTILTGAATSSIAVPVASAQTNVVSISDSTKPSKLGATSSIPTQVVVPDIALSFDDVSASATPPPPEPEPEVVEEQTQQQAASRSEQRSGTSTAATQTDSYSYSQVQNTNVVDAQGDDMGSAIVAEASKYIGIPYVWGGTTTSGFDCSGLTQYVYARFGISIPRLAEDQTATLQHVSNPQPGDIVAWGYHVGIYAGNGMVIHAPKPGDVVKISPVWGSPAYVRAR